MPGGRPAIRTLEEIREQNRLRQRKYYYNNKDKVTAYRRERYKKQKEQRSQTSVHIEEA